MKLSAASRTLRNLGKQGLHRLFEVGQRFGVDVLPRHFYSSIPDLRALKSTEHWRQPFSMIGIEGSAIDRQLAFVEECCPDAVRRRLAQGDIFAHACAENGEEGYGPIEAELLYGFIVEKRPPRVVQIGAGVSTGVIMLAMSEAGYRGEVVCIDPYPTRYLREMAHAGRIELLEQKAQIVALDALTDVGEGGLLFVDSTHTVQPGGEVNRIILEVLPRLATGSYVHFHDIYFPYDYPRDILDATFFPAETTLLHAFLTHNARCAMRVSMSMLHYAAPAELSRLLPNYHPAPQDLGLRRKGSGGHFPSSTYLEMMR